MEKYSSLLCPFVSYEENEVLPGIQIDVVQVNGEASWL